MQQKLLKPQAEWQLGSQKRNGRQVLHPVTFFFFFSVINYYKILNRVPCAIQWVLVGYLFYMWLFASINPQLLIYLPHPPSSPLVTVSLFSTSVSLFLFCK